MSLEKAKTIVSVTVTHENGFTETLSAENLFLLSKGSNQQRMICQGNLENFDQLSADQTTQAIALILFYNLQKQLEG